MAARKPVKPNGFAYTPPSKLTPKRQPSKAGKKKADPQLVGKLFSGASRSPATLGVGGKSSGKVKVKKKRSVLDRVPGLSLVKGLLDVEGKVVGAAGKTIGAADPTTVGKIVGASAGVKPSDKQAATLGKVSKGVVNLATIVPSTTAKNVVDKPSRFLSDTAKSALGIPAGLVRLAVHPEAGVKAIGKSYADYYGSAVRGDAKAFDKKQKEQGAAQAVFDLAGIGSAGGATLGRVGQTLARSGTLGSRLERVATAVPRPLRYSGGVEGVVQRDISPNLLKNVARHQTDKVRARVQTKRYNAGRRDGVIDEAQKAGDVTYVLAPKGKSARIRAVAAQGGRGLAMFKAENAQETGGRKTGTIALIRGLSKPEQQAWKYAAQYGIKDAASARRILSRLKAYIETNRTAEIARLAKKGDKPDWVIDELPTIEKLIANADAAFTPRLWNAVSVERRRAKRLGRLDSGLKDVQAAIRPYMPAGDLLGVARRSGNETALDYVNRVRAAMQREGLDLPAYFKSEEIPKLRHAVFTKRDRRAAAEDKTYTGALTKLGRESNSPEILIRQNAGNISRRFSWNLVAETIDKHSFGWSKQRKYTAHQVLKQLEHRKINPDSVRLWNPRLMRERAISNVGDLNPTDEAMVQQTIAKELADHPPTIEINGQGKYSFSQSSNRADFKTAGWQVVPKDVYDELMAGAKGSMEGLLGRGWDIGKGKASRILLANPAWLGFQVSSNALLAGIAGVTPADMLRGQRVFSRLPARVKAEAESIFGVHPHYDQQRRLGSVTPGNRLFNGYQAMKETAFYRKAHEKNPLDMLFFRPDNAQNNAFRRGLMYSRLKREHYQRMNQDVGTIVTTQRKIMDALGQGNRDAAIVKMIRDEPQLLEKHAKAVNDFLGNWTTYTAQERHVVSRVVMFYGFLRFSTRLAFHTMPLEHPIMSSILLQLGRLEKDELERIFGSVGAKPPLWEYGNLFAPQKTFGQNVKAGDNVARFPLVRMVPFFNAVTGGKNVWRTGVAALPPPAQWIINAAAGKNVALGQPYKVDGSTNEVRNDLSIGNMLQITLGDFLRLNPYYRAAERIALKGAQGADSSLVFPRPTRYVAPAAKARNRRKIKQQQQLGAFGSLRESLFPLAGTNGLPQLETSKQFAQKKKPSSNAGGDSWGSGWSRGGRGGDW